MVDFRVNESVTVAEVIEVYRDAGLPRPVDDPARIEKMFAGSQIVVTARDGRTLVGVARSLADGAWNCYLADLAVRREYQHGGIGRRLVELTRETAGAGSMLLLLSVPEAMDYYPKIGLERIDYGFILKREF